MEPASDRRVLQCVALRSCSRARLAAVALPSRPDAADPAQQPVFRGGVDLVTLDVRVIDKDGKPVRGLKPEDFVVTLEKQPRPVRALDFLEFGSAAGSTAEARQTTNQAGQAQPARRGGRVVVLLFDDLVLQAGARQGAARRGRADAQHVRRRRPDRDHDDERAGTDGESDAGSRRAPRGAARQEDDRAQRRHHGAVLHRGRRGHRDRPRHAARDA